MSSEYAPSRVLVQIPFLLSGTQFGFCVCPLNLHSFTSYQTLGDDTLSSGPLGPSQDLAWHTKGPLTCTLKVPD